MRWRQGWEAAGENTHHSRRPIAVHAAHTASFLHPEHAYDFHLADLAAAGRLRAINAYVDSPARPPKRLLFDSELAPDAMRRVAAHFAAEHGVMGIELGLAGCADGDDANAGGCAAVDAIVAKMRHAPADPGPQSRCDFALEGILCCG